MTAELDTIQNATAEVAGGSPEAVLAAQAILDGSSVYESMSNAKVGGVGGQNPEAVKAAQQLLSGLGQESAMDRALAQAEAALGQKGGGTHVANVLAGRGNDQGFTR